MKKNKESMGLEFFLFDKTKIIVNPKYCILVVFGLSNRNINYLPLIY